MLLSSAAYDCHVGDRSFVDVLTRGKRCVYVCATAPSSGGRCKGRRWISCVGVNRGAGFGGRECCGLSGSRLVVVTYIFIRRRISRVYMAGLDDA